jgi:hypothetical protein
MQQTIESSCIKITKKLDREVSTKQTKLSILRINEEQAVPIERRCCFVNSKSIPNLRCTSEIGYLCATLCNAHHTYTQSKGIVDNSGCYSNAFNASNNKNMKVLMIFFFKIDD